MKATATEAKAIFYLRVSTDRQTDGAAAQLELLRAAAIGQGVALPVSQEALTRAIVLRQNEIGPLYLDFGISGYFDSTRPGYQKFLHRALNDSAITHVFTPARDRMARPEDAAEFASREHRIRAAGKTLVVGTKVLPPLHRGDDNLVDTITASLEYGQGRAYLDSLANKMVAVKANKAKAGCWTGGRAPYGFVRVLVNPQGGVERALKNGESIRQPGYTVSLRCGDVERIRVWHDLVLKQFDPAGPDVGGKQIGNILNARGIASPDAGRLRRTKYESEARSVPGTWTSGMIYALLDNPAIAGVLRYGKRAMGEHARLGQNGVPRKLTNLEAPSPDMPAKVSENPEEVQIVVKGTWLTEDGWLLDVAGKKCFKVDLALFERCQRKRKANAGTQRGLPRCHDPHKYPLAGRVRCAHCGSVMHGIPTSYMLRYTCGTYINSGGAKCDHNWVKQDNLMPDVLATLRESALPHVEELRQTLRKAAAEKKDLGNARMDRADLEKARERQARLVQKAIEAVSQAQDEDERTGLRQIYRRERSKMEGLDADLREAQTPVQCDPQADLVEAALEELKNLRCKLDHVTDRVEIAELLRSLNVRVWLKFRKVQWGTRWVNRLESGVVCLGSAPDPEGTTSFSKVNRGDWICSVVKIPLGDAELREMHRRNAA